MMMKALTSLSLMMSILFICVSHPLNLGLILIIQTTVVALILGVMSQNFWFSYILFLVIIGGMLIIFIYVISLIFNKAFTQTLNFPLVYIALLVFALLSYMASGMMEMNSLESSMNYKFPHEIAMNLIKLYNFPMNLINLMMISYLFFLLIVVVKITKFEAGPLRMKI